MGRVSAALKAATKVALADAVKVSRKELESSARPHTGGDLRLSGLRNARMAVRSRQGDESVTVYATGPWGIIQPGARRHRIGAPRQSMPIGGDQVRRGPFNHPGTRNTRAWDRGRDRAFDVLGRTVPDQIGDAVEGAF